MDYLLYILIGILIILVFILLLNNQNRNNNIIKYIDKELEKKQTENRNSIAFINKNIESIKSSLSNELLNFNHHLNEDFSSLTDKTQSRLTQLENNVNSNIKDNYKYNSETLLSINDRISKIDSAQKNLIQLSSDINNLQSILQDKKSRGTFGEIELYSLLESYYGDNKDFWEKQYTFPNGKTVDAIIKGTDNLKLIPIDSKFPLENYQRLYSDEYSKEEKASIHKAFKKDVINHLNDIYSKYLISGITSEFAYMFVPAEAVFAEIYSNVPEAIDLSYKLHVYIVSPTTLMAYLTAIRSIYLGHKRDKNAKEILKLLDDLSIEFERYYERLNKTKSSLDTFVKSFDDLLITSDKINKKFNKIKAGTIDEKD